MLELDEQLRRYIDSTAPPVGLGHVDRGAVIEAGSEPPESRRRRPLAVTAAATVLVLIGVIAFRAGDPIEDTILPTVTYEDLGPVTDAVADPLPRPDGAATSLAWARGTAPEGADTFVQLLSDDELFYWVGAGLYWSSDGEVWTEVEFERGLPSLLQRGTLHDAWDGRVAAASATNSGVTVQVAGLDGSVHATVLSPSLGALPETAIVDIWAHVATIGGRGMLVAARLTVQDFGELIEQALSDEADQVLSVSLDRTADREALLVQLPERTERVVFSDYGFRNSSAFEVAPTGTIGWRSTDGVNWTPITSGGPFGIDGGFEQTVTATSTGFVGVTNDGNGWFSADGATWSRVGGGTSPDCCERPVRWGADIVVGLSDENAVAIGESGVVDLSFEAWPPRSDLRRSFAAGEFGIAYLVDVDPDAHEYDFVYSPDGASWTRLQPPDGFGDPYCCYFDAFGVAVGPDRLAVIADAGDVLELWLLK